MGIIEYKLDFWELDEKGEIYFKGTETAILYAILIFNDTVRVSEIKRLKTKCLRKIGALKKLEDLDLDYLFKFTCRYQFYRECLDEVERLKHSSYLLNDLA